MASRRPWRGAGLLLVACLTVQLLSVVLAPQPSLAAAPPVTVQLTTDPAADVRPAWSPDGKSVAFQTTRGGGGNFTIWTMDADGTNQRAVTRGSADDRHPFWSQDGRQLAFDSASEGIREIWVANKDGSRRRQVTRLGHDSSFPAWSPDGRQITSFSYKDGVLSLWIVGADGANPQPLVPTVSRQQENQCAFPCHQALWSADGKRIAYGGGDRRSIWVVSPEGGDPTQVARRAGREPQHFPWWLRDGRLGYIVEHVTTAASWTDAWALQLPGGSPALVQDKIAHQGPLQWSPDESKVLFHSPRGGNFDIYAIDRNAPGGLEALQGAGAGEVTPASTSASVPLYSQMNPALLAGAGLGGLALIAAVAGLLFWRRR